MNPNPLLLVVGGYGVVGAQICTLLAARNPALRLLVAGRDAAKAAAAAAALPLAEGCAIDIGDPDPLAALPERPDAILVAVNDRADRLLLSAARRGIAIVDIARWQARIDDAHRQLAGMALTAPLILSSGWMAGAAAIVAAAGRQDATPAAHIDIDIYYAAKDKAGPDSVAGFIDIHRPFTIHEAGVPRTVRGLSHPKAMRFSDGRRVKTRLFSCPDQASLVDSGVARGVAVRMAFDDAVTTGALALLARSGLWSLLPAATRRSLLYNPGPGAAHEFVVDVVEQDGGRRRTRVRDPLGQTHLTAASAASQVERVLGLNARAPVPPGIGYPEQAADLAADIAALGTMGVEIVRDPMSGGVAPGGGAGG